MVKRISYYVTKEIVCSRCDGRRKIQSALWNAYFEWERQLGRIPESAEVSNWWAEIGFFDDDGGLPAEEIDCPDCEGEGVLIEKVELVDALRNVGVIQLRDGDQ